MSCSVFVILAVIASAGPQAAGGTPMELSFERVIAKPGEAAAVPIYLVSEANYQEPFQITLEFPASQLEFHKVEPDYLAQRAKWTLAATVADHPEKPGRRILRIDVTPGGSSFFPSGLVGRAHFLVSHDSPEGDIPLDAALVAPKGSKPVPAAEPARVSVLTAPIFGCFFYMH